MRLSDAIATGRVMGVHLDPNNFCGCAIALGLEAVGKRDRHSSSANFSTAKLEWPWLDACFDHPLIHIQDTGVGIVSDLFWEVYNGDRTLDELIDWVRSVEPPEETPVVEAVTPQAEQVCV